MIRLTELPSEILKMINDGTLTAGQVRPLLAIHSPEDQIEQPAPSLRAGYRHAMLSGLWQCGRAPRAIRSIRCGPKLVFVLIQM